MKKYLLVSLTFTLITVSVFLGYLYYQKSQIQVTNEISFEENPNLNFKDFVEVNQNLTITKIFENKMSLNKNETFNRILIPNTWVVENSGKDLYASSNDYEFIYYKKFFLETNPDSKLTLDLLKTDNYKIEESFAENFPENEKPQVIQQIKDFISSNLELNYLIRMENINNIAANFQSAKTLPIEELIFTPLEGLSNRQISGNFTYSRYYEGNNRIIHEYLSTDNKFVWLMKDSENSFIYAYGYLDKIDTRDFFKVLFLNLE